MTHPSHARTVLVIACLAVPLSAAAQSGGRTAAIEGEVIHAESGLPISDATLTLFRHGARIGRYVTDSIGRYRFDGLPRASYRLRVERLGFRTVDVTVDVAPATEAQVWIELELVPVPLSALVAEATRPGGFDRMGSGADSVGTSEAIRWRQARYLSPDVRVVTYADLLAGVTVAEPDLFRALQRLPGTAGRDDWSAELLTRGAEWDETRIVFDGMPLFSPLHGGGVLSGVNADGLGSTVFHPGLAPFDESDGGAAVALTSRRGGASDGVSGLADLSVLSARLALDGPLASGRGGWMVALRRSHLDRLLPYIGGLMGASEPSFPFRFADAIGRLDLPLGARSTLVASALFQDDLLTGEIADVVDDSRVNWRNLTAQMTWETEWRGRRLLHTAGATRYLVDLDTMTFRGGSRLTAPRADPIDHGLLHVQVGGRWIDDGLGSGWTAGWRLVRQDARTTGVAPPAHLDYPDTSGEELRLRDALSVGSVWYDRRWRGTAVDLDAGLRVDLGPGVRHGGRVRASPRVTVRARPSDAISISVSGGRSWQYVQAARPIGGVREEFPSGYLWLLAGEHVPALRSETVLVGGEAWLSHSWLASVRTYLRRGDGVIGPDPRPGLTGDRPLFVAMDERGEGAEVELRKAEGRLTGFVAYTLARTRRRAGGMEFSAPGDRRHELEASLLWRLGGWRVSSAFAWHSGLPYTRVFALAAGGMRGSDIGVLAAPGAARRPGFTSTDLGAGWTHRFDGWELETWLQVKNLFATGNTGTYVGSELSCGLFPNQFNFTEVGTRCSRGPVSRVDETWAPRVQDEFLPGFPALPSLGVSIRW